MEQTIIENKNKKYIRKYKKNIKNYSKIPISIIMKLVNSSKIYTPKMLKNTPTYIDLEYIKGTNIDKTFNKKLLKETIINYIVSMNNIDCRKIYKYIPWKNNTEYLKYLVSELAKTKKTFSHNTKIIIELLNIGNEELDRLKKHKLDNHRKMSLIHNNISYDKMLLKFNRVYLLDWEYANYADISHSLAIHFSLMDYTENGQNYILEILSKKLNIDLNKLKRDIKIYTIYEIIKKIYLKIHEITKREIKSNKDLKELYNYYINLSKLTKIDVLPFNEIEEIFKKIK